MSSELRELYQEVILDHNKRPRNFGTMESPTASAEGYNPLCGDRLSVQLEAAEGVIRDVRFTGSGCAISKASASLMTEAVKGRSVADADALFATFHAMVTSAPDAPVAEDMGKLVALAGVREFPARVKCASLAWHTLQSALHGRASATTEQES